MPDAIFPCVNLNLSVSESDLGALLHIGWSSM